MKNVSLELKYQAALYQSQPIRTLIKWYTFDGGKLNLKKCLFFLPLHSYCIYLLNRMAACDPQHKSCSRGLWEEVFFSRKIIDGYTIIICIDDFHLVRLPDVRWRHGIVDLIVQIYGDNLIQKVRVKRWGCVQGKYEKPNVKLRMFFICIIYVSLIVLDKLNVNNLLLINFRYLLCLIRQVM